MSAAYIIEKGMRNGDSSGRAGYICMLHALLMASLLYFSLAYVTSEVNLKQTKPSGFAFIYRCSTEENAGMM